MSDVVRIAGWESRYKPPMWEKSYGNGLVKESSTGTSSRQLYALYVRRPTCCIGSKLRWVAQILLSLDEENLTDGLAIETGTGTALSSAYRLGETRLTCCLSWIIRCISEGVQLLIEGTCTDGLGRIFATGTTSKRTYLNRNWQTCWFRDHCTGWIRREQRRVCFYSALLALH